MPAYEPLQHFSWQKTAIAFFSARVKSTVVPAPLVLGSVEPIAIIMFGQLQLDETTLLCTVGDDDFSSWSRLANPALYWAKLMKSSLPPKWSLQRWECFVGASKSARFVCTNRTHFRKISIQLRGNGCSDTFPLFCLAVQFAAAQNAGIFLCQKTPVQGMPHVASKSCDTRVTSHGNKIT